MDDKRRDERKNEDALRRHEPKQTLQGTVHSLVDRNGTNCSNGFEEREDTSDPAPPIFITKHRGKRS